MNKQAFISEVEFSHSEPVTDLMWLSSKLGTDFITSSTDGSVFWWDIREPGKPIDQLKCIESTEDEVGIGCTKIEYNPEYGPKYLLGTEKGSILLANKKPKKSVDINLQQSYGLDTGRHLGPVYALQRNPLNPRYFLSVGDWSVKIWDEDLKTPIVRTRYHASYLTDGCWSPSRSGVYFVTRKDGWLDIWDYYYRQNEIALSHKVSDFALTAIRLNSVTASSMQGIQHHNVGRYAAIGDANGTVILLELCKSLWETQTASKEKDEIGMMFDREKRKEDILKKQRMEGEAKKLIAAKKEQSLNMQKAKMEEAEARKEDELKKLESEFFDGVEKTEEEMAISEDSEDESTKRRPFVERPARMKKSNAEPSSPSKLPDPVVPKVEVQPKQPEPSKPKTPPQVEPEKPVPEDSKIKEVLPPQLAEEFPEPEDGEIEKKADEVPVSSRAIDWEGEIQIEGAARMVTFDHLEIIGSRVVGRGSDEEGEYQIDGEIRPDEAFTLTRKQGEKTAEYSGKVEGFDLVGKSSEEEGTQTTLKWKPRGSLWKGSIGANGAPGSVPVDISIVLKNGLLQGLGREQTGRGFSVRGTYTDDGECLFILSNFAPG